MDMDSQARNSPTGSCIADAGRSSGWKEASAPSDAGSCRANSRRGITDQVKPSYPPVESVRRALAILRTVNRLKIATVGEIHAATKLPKPTIVRMLDTLIADGYVARDNMCGGYHVTRRVQELDSGYEGIAQIIEVSRPFAIDLTNRIKWPVGIGTLDGDAIAVHFWTGTISPWVHANTLLGHRPNLVTSAMGRAYLAFCGEEERQAAIKAMREKGRPGSPRSRRNSSTHSWPAFAKRVTPCARRRPSRDATRRSPFPYAPAARCSLRSPSASSPRRSPATVSWKPSSIRSRKRSARSKP